jgi:hypothetical protein
MHTNPWIGRNVHIWAPIPIWNSKSESGQTLENWVSGRGPSAHGPRTIRSIRNWTVRLAMQTVWIHQAANHSPPLRGPSATGSKSRAEAAGLLFLLFATPLSPSTRQKGLLCRLCTDGEGKLCTDNPTACEKFNQHVVITVFHNLMDFIKSIQFWDYSDFLSDLKLSNSFTNLIGGIVSATRYECYAKI